MIDVPVVDLFLRLVHDHEAPEREEALDVERDAELVPWYEHARRVILGSQKIVEHRRVLASERPGVTGCVREAHDRPHRSVEDGMVELATSDHVRRLDRGELLSDALLPEELAHEVGRVHRPHVGSNHSQDELARKTPNQREELLEHLHECLG